MLNIEVMGQTTATIFYFYVWRWPLNLSIKTANTTQDSRLHGHLVRIEELFELLLLSLLLLRGNLMLPCRTLSLIFFATSRCFLAFSRFTLNNHSGESDPLFRAFR